VIRYFKLDGPSHWGKKWLSNEARLEVFSGASQGQRDATVLMRGNMNENNESEALDYDDGARELIISQYELDHLLKTGLWMCLRTSVHDDNTQYALVDMKGCHEAVVEIERIREAKGEQ